METFEDFAIFILLIFFAVSCYLAGKGNILELIPLLIQEKVNELEKSIKEIEEAEKALAKLEEEEEPFHDTV